MVTCFASLGVGSPALAGNPARRPEKGSSSFWVTVHLYKEGVALYNWILIVSGFLIDFQLLVTDSQNNLGVNVHSSN